MFDIVVAFPRQCCFRGSVRRAGSQRRDLWNGDGGIKGPNGDNYLYSHLQVDAQGSFRMAKGFTAVVYGLNLTNEVFGFYQGSTIYPIQREYYNRTIGAGLRWSSTAEHN